MDLVVPANLAAYCVQVTAIVLVAGPLPRLLGVHEPQFRYVYWRTVLLACALLPWLQPWQAAATVGPTTAAPAGAVSTEASLATVAPAAPVSGRAVAWGLVLGALVRAAWLMAGMVRLGRLRRLGNPVDLREFGDLQQAIGTRAELRYVADAGQPVTFGLWRPCVLLPSTLRQQPESVRRAVVAHELWHVRRRDWAWMIGEEAVRTALWFQPGVWWLAARIRLAREELVDQLAVTVTGEREAYLKALLAFSNASASIAPGFAQRQHLFRRMLLIAREDVMSARRLVVSGVLMLAIALVGAWYVVHAFPMTEASNASAYRAPGPLEREAARISPSLAAPRLIGDQPTVYPADPLTTQMSARVTVRAVVDAHGSVAETRVVGLELASAVSRAAVHGEDFHASLERFLQRSTFHTAPGAAPIPAETMRALVEAFVQSAITSVRGYRYEAPAVAPIAFDVTVHFAGRRADAEALQYSPLADGALRVGATIRPPRKIHDVRPVYPESARAAGIQGVVILEVRIEGDGRVSQARVLRSVPELDRAAIDAVGQWRFEPTLLNGAPAPVVMVVTVKFAT